MNIKMNSGKFWGILLIIIGLGIFFRVVFGFDFPILRFIVAFVLIYLGIKVLFGNFGIFNMNYHENDAVFKEIKVAGNPDHEEYNVIFGKSEFDLRDIDISKGPVKVKLNTIFGSTRFVLNKNTPVKIELESVFADARMPDGTSAIIGNNQYESEHFNNAENHLYIKVDIAFGAVDIKTG